MRFEWIAPVAIGGVCVVPSLTIYQKSTAQVVHRAGIGSQ
jgi:hypothetical protein